MVTELKVTEERTRYNTAPEEGVDLEADYGVDVEYEDVPRHQQEKNWKAIISENAYSPRKHHEERVPYVTERKVDTMDTPRPLSESGQRTCAVCQKPITGKSNKLTCSPACQKKLQRQGKKVSA